jgi:hypothetical protein
MSNNQKKSSEGDTWRFECAPSKSVSNAGDAGAAFSAATKDEAPVVEMPKNTPAPQGGQKFHVET